MGQQLMGTLEGQVGGEQWIESVRREDPLKEAPGHRLCSGLQEEGLGLCSGCRSFPVELQWNLRPLPTGACDPEWWLQHP